MLKSWFISLLVVLLLAASFKLKLFNWLATGSAIGVGAALVVIMLIVAFFVLGNPWKKS